VVWGGFVGCEVAASLRTRGVRVDLVEALAGPLVRVLGPAGAAVVTGLLVERGVTVHAGVGPAEVLGTGSVTGVRLADGTVLETEVLVLGLGVAPDLAWLDGSGIEVADGIVCDGTGRTSADRVWALGDAAGWPHPLAGGRARVEHWTSTTEQAAVVAGDIVTGESTALDAVPYFWSDLFDTKIQALGFVDPAADPQLVTSGGRTVITYSRGGRLTAVVGFSAPRAVMGLRAAVAAGEPVDAVLARLAGG
jgi:3-phenylpropionate/trans-cinnamate dioxygenase ferredoxin reductase component